MYKGPFFKMFKKLLNKNFSKKIYFFKNNKSWSCKYFFIHFKAFLRIVVVKDLCSWLIPLRPWTPVKLTLSLSFSLALMSFISHLFCMMKMRKLWMTTMCYSSNSLIFMLCVVVCLFIIDSIHMLSTYLIFYSHVIVIIFECPLTCYLCIYLTCFVCKYSLELTFTC